MDAISSLSRPYVYVWIEGAYGTETVQLAFTGVGVKPTEDDWRAAEWNTASITREGAEARVLVGPGSPNELPVGTYDVWARVTAPVEQPVMLAGQLPIV
ncbi:hypothetical protein [Nonomuraea aridisoli]|uniref:Intracellular proteinase inhibitor BsuPI domain-containing protein n=1 Tax=Nonomuraea aridisoli TaxID=2070368 RepID=A0A2W2EUZ4_9ACTN|nr:hypothetical protein [Nonomuraea aridisoli]PZG20619.1 hypothetical protein C1J01_08950 [Nonomuraea aridisoli]